MPTHKLVVEEATGTWCGWCPRGAVFLDSLNKVHPTTTVCIAVHNQDPMTDATYDSGMGTLIAGYPSVLVDRSKESVDPSTVFTHYTTHIGDFGVADLNLTPSFNSTTRVATISVDAKMASTFSNNNANSDFRLAVVFTENHVTGTATGYNQANYYSYTSQNQALSGAGHNWQTSPNPVPAANMVYDFVARTIVGGFNGQANSLPSSITAGSTYNQSFSYTVPVGYNENNMEVSALLIDAKNKIIFNANRVKLTTTGIAALNTGKQDFVMYPNPAANQLNIAVNTISSETVVLSIVNALGQVVYSEAKNNLPAGESNITLNTENLVNGIYMVSLSSKQGAISKKLIINK